MFKQREHEYRPVPPEERRQEPRKPLSVDWSQRCLKEAGGNVVYYLTKIAPNTTYFDFESMVNNEGYRIDEAGFLVPCDPLTISGLNNV